MLVLNKVEIILTAWGSLICCYLYHSKSSATFQFPLLRNPEVTSITGNEEAVTKQISGLHTTLSGLRRYTNYSVTVCAFTAAGDGVRAAPVYCHTEEDGN